MIKYYAVLKNASGWTNEKLSIEDFEQREYQVRKSRLSPTQKLVFKNDILVGYLFETKIEAMEYINYVKGK